MSPKYKTLLAEADRPRESDLDGRGALSQRALINFCQFFLKTCVDQVSYMQSILKPAELLRRMERYAQGEIGARSTPILRSQTEGAKSRFYDAGAVKETMTLL